jgi:hypothetical protein
MGEEIQLFEVGMYRSELHNYSRRFVWLKGCAWSSSMMEPLHIIAVW